MKIKQLIFSDRREITHGNTRGVDWILYGYKDQETGYEYSSLEGGYLLNAPITIEYTEHEVKKKKGEGFFINRRITRQVGGETPSKTKIGDEILAKLEEIQESVEEIKQWTRSKDAEKH